MGESNWRHRLGRVPVLGNLAAGLRGVYSLRAWRASLRQDIADLRRDLQTASARLDHLDRLRDELQARQDRAFEAQADRLSQARAAEQAERDAWRRDIEAWLGEEAERGERRLAAGTWQAAQVQSALDQVRAVVRDSRRASSPADTRGGDWPTAVSGAVAVAALAEDVDAASWREWQTLLPDDARVLVLPPETPTAWAAGLQALPTGSLSALAAPSGAAALDAAGMRAFARAAVAVLAPGGQLAIRLDNPENAAVAAALCNAGPGVFAWTPDALTSALCEAGLAPVALWRLDPAMPVFEGEGEAAAAVNRLLAGPRRFLAVAGRDD